MCAFFICILYLSKNIKNYSLKPSYVLPHLVVYRSFPGKFLIMFARKKKNGQSKGELCTISLTPRVALVPGWCFASGRPEQPQGLWMRVCSVKGRWALGGASSPRRQD